MSEDGCDVRFHVYEHACGDQVTAEISAMAVARLARQMAGALAALAETVRQIQAIDTELTLLQRTMHTDHTLSMKRGQR